MIANFNSMSKEKKEKLKKFRNKRKMNEDSMNEKEQDIVSENKADLSNKHTENLVTADSTPKTAVPAKETKASLTSGPTPRKV